MSTVKQNIGSAIPTLKMARGGGMGGIERAIELLPIINVAGTSLPVPRTEMVSNGTVGMEPVLRMKGVGDIYGMDESGDVIVVRYSTAGSLLEHNLKTGLRETKTLVKRTKTTSSEKAKETDDRVVHLGLFVAILGLLSIIV